VARGGDVLVSFRPDAPWHLMHLVEMREELEQIFGREVDLVEKSALRNPFRRHEILTTLQPSMPLERSDPAHLWDMLQGDATPPTFAVMLNWTAALGR